MIEIRSLYLDLMKKAVSGAVYAEKPIGRLHQTLPARRWQKSLYTSTRSTLEHYGLSLMRLYRSDLKIVAEGTHYNEVAFSMIGMKRLDNLQFCCEEVIRNRVPGDFIETGVWRGGAVIFMRAVLKAYGIDDRTVWAADSFCGLPPPNPAKYPADRGDHLHTHDELRVSLEDVKSNFSAFGLLDSQVMFLKGWFSETLSTAPIARLAVLRLDGDMYESTMDALTCLYPKLSRGGYVIIDDYALPGCHKAVDDFRARCAIKEEMKRIDWSGVYWQRAD
ncbi:TylF/MycF/NovP-related O-methyltransferase [Candidatus Binatus soli]|jgi:O-methyltransferase|uniref:TylF/MycF/NovP-related O-methyltransferase n=1 Tax=Candidatus Binatus soli TaxID=1953413 RepID=UPI003D0CBA34